MALFALTMAHPAIVLTGDLHYHFVRKTLLLDIFFISIGASLNFTLIGNQFWMIGGLVAGLILIKAIAVFLIAKIFKMPVTERLLFSIALAQGGKFAFVLFQFARSNGVLSQWVTETLISVVAIAMFLAPLLFMVHDRLIAPRLQKTVAERAPDVIETEERSVVLAGFGRLGTDLGRMLMSATIKPDPHY